MMEKAASLLRETGAGLWLFSSKWKQNCPLLTPCLLILPSRFLIRSSPSILELAFFVLFYSEEQILSFSRNRSFSARLAQQCNKQTVSSIWIPDKMLSGCFLSKAAFRSV